jgi:transmembrane sensor
MAAPIDPLILGEAADWLVQLHSGEASSADRQAIEQWRGRSAQHAQAWQRAEALLGDFRNVPAGIAVQTLRNVDRRKGLARRQVLNRLGLLLLGGPVAWAAWREVPWQAWSADLQTATGEQKKQQLPDGSQLLLNTATAVNIAFNEHERVIRLVRGEVLITTAHDPRPFKVQTGEGSVRALGTRFSVRELPGRVQVAVSEGSVAIAPTTVADESMVKAGEEVWFSAARVSPPEALRGGAWSWENGMLLAQGMRLAEVLEELNRYRPGLLRCHADVADLRVSGALSLRDTDASLRLLQDTLPIEVSRMTPWWVSVQARG